MSLGGVLGLIVCLLDRKVQVAFLLSPRTWRNLLHPHEQSLARSVAFRLGHKNVGINVSRGWFLKKVVRWIELIFIHLLFVVLDSYINYSLYIDTIGHMMFGRGSRFFPKRCQRIQYQSSMIKFDQITTSKDPPRNYTYRIRLPRYPMGISKGISKVLGNLSWLLFLHAVFFHHLFSDKQLWAQLSWELCFLCQMACGLMWGELIIVFWLLDIWVLNQK